MPNHDDPVVAEFLRSIGAGPEKAPPPPRPAGKKGLAGVIEQLGVAGHQTAIGLGEGAGWVASKIPGDPLGGQAIMEQAQRERAMLPTASGGAQQAANIIGRIAGEGATMLAGGGATGSLITKVAPASRVARAILAGRQGSLAARTAANTIPYAPVDFTLGAGSSPEGERVQGGLANVALGVAGAGAIEGVVTGTRAVRGARAARSQMAQEAAGRQAEEAAEAALARRGMLPSGPRPGAASPYPGTRPQTAPAAGTAPGAPGASSTAGAIDPNAIDPDEFVNVSKFNLDPYGEQILRDEVARTVAETGQAPKEVISWAETRRLASEIGVGDIPLSGKTRLTGPEALKLREVVQDNIKSIEAGLLRRHELTSTLPAGDPRLRASLDKVDGQIHALEMQNSALLGKFVSARSQTGRDLNNLKILAQDSMDPMIWYAKAQKRLGKEPFTDAMRAEIDRLIASRDKLGLPNYVASLGKGLGPTDIEFWTTLRKAGLLFNPRTHARNTISNALQAPLEAIKDAPAAVADYFASFLTGQRTKDFNALASAKASMRGVRDGIREAKQVLKYGMDDAAARKLEIPHEVKFNNAFLDGYTKLSFNLMSAGDKPFKNAALFRSIAEQARVVAKREGLKGEAYAKRVAELMDTPTSEMALTAIADAEHAVFQNTTRLSQAGSAVKRHMGPVMDLPMPFVKTPASIAGKVVEYSPLGLIETGIKGAQLGNAIRKGSLGPKEIRALQKEFADRFGRNVTGSAGAIALGYYLASNGQLTPPKSKSRKEDQQAELAGRPPDAVQFNGRSWLLKGVAPAGNLIMFGNALYHHLNDPDMNAASVVAQSAGGVGQAILDQSFLQGTKELLEGVEDPRQMDRVARNTVASFVPSAAAAAARVIDPTVRQPAGVRDAIANRVPGLSRTVPAKVDQIGQDVRRDEDLGTRALVEGVDPTISRRISTDPVVTELEKYGVNVSRVQRRPAKVVDGVKVPRETDAELRARQREIGEEFRRQVEATIASPGYQRLTPEQKKDELEHIDRMVRRQHADGKL